MAVKLFRWIYTFIGIAVGYVVYQVLDGFIAVAGNGNSTFAPMPVLFAASFGALGFLLTPVFVKRGRVQAKKIESALMKMPADRIARYAAGLLLGALIAFLISPVFSIIGNDFLRVSATVLDYVIAIYLSVIFSTSVQVSRWTSPVAARDYDKVGQGIEPRDYDKVKRDGEPRRLHPKILDTGVILEGKIAEIIASGFLDGDIVIPEFVLVELRHVADSADSVERSRGRRGLDMLNGLRADCGIEIYDTDHEPALEGIKDTETKLLKLAQKLGGKIVTDNAGLVKMAAISGIDVLNVSKLSRIMKESASPGERLTVNLIKEGKKDGQAIAYLGDGTMVVVEEGRRHIGGTADVTVTRVQFTSGGRMVFAELR